MSYILKSYDQQLSENFSGRGFRKTTTKLFSLNGSIQQETFQTEAFPALKHLPSFYKLVFLARIALHFDTSISNFLWLCGKFNSPYFWQSATRLNQQWQKVHAIEYKTKPQECHLFQKSFKNCLKLFSSWQSGKRGPQGWTNDGKKYRLLNYKTHPQKLCWHFSGVQRQRDHFQGFYPSRVKHDRHFCGWLTSSAVALYALSVLGTHPTPLDSGTPPNNPLVGSRTPQVHL